MSKNIKLSEISAANLPDEFLIDDPKLFIQQMRTSFLISVRESKKLSVDDVSNNIGVSSDELSRIESGNVNETDIMALYELSTLYSVDYFHLLLLFKLADVSRNKEYGLAAYNNSNIDNDTQKVLLDFVKFLKAKKHE